ncbi:TauD/TfdA family dioxygenase [Amycolatopsis roodepoortensis]|uniref:TauD/TfdA family dioxygenase n=1 Tax=Amycolatopsis roodepoortensis TaxID=700274 RepID=UPI00214CFB07|nr:TauD/TfdA family dioxygenase [Amycolatopsis roodepoortensis]UUV32298.1 TauD/TfdA family dioxygenase [Amycolatopsis roodepoortensis]
MTTLGNTEAPPPPLDVTHPDAAERITAALAEHGVAVFRGVTGRAALLRLATELGSVVLHPHSDPEGVTTITARSGATRPGMAAFTDNDLTPHTDRSNLSSPPAVVMAVCSRAAPTGGETVLVDGRAVHAALWAHTPEAVADLAGARGVLFGGAAGYLGAVFEPRADGRIAIRLRLDDLARFSPRARRWLPLLRQAIREHSDTLALPAGHGYVVNNRWWLHGRHRFSGDRVMWRVLLDPPPGRVHTGFLPAAATSLPRPHPRMNEST